MNDMSRYDYTGSRKRISVGIVDYKNGNHSSVINTLRTLGFRVCVGDDATILEDCDVLVLPGVGAFPAAMKALKEKGLESFLRVKAEEHFPIIGICLGMQLLADSSQEYELTEGLKLIPGNVVPLNEPKWHIGWNTIKKAKNDPLFHDLEGQAYYFNHSYVYEGPEEFKLCCAEHHAEIPAIIRNGSVIGMQFHPEKSQHFGAQLLKRVVTGLFINA